MEINRQKKAELLQRAVKHIDIKSHDPRGLINAYKEMSFSARELGRACEIYEGMLEDNGCTIILTIAGSTSARLHADLCRSRAPQHGRHHRGDRGDRGRHGLLRGSRLSPLSRNAVRGRRQAARSVHRPYLRHVHRRGGAAALRPIRRSPMACRRGPSSREFISEMGRWLTANPAHAAKSDSSCRSPMSEASRYSARRSPTAARASGWSPTRSHGRMGTSASTRCATFAS